MIHKTLTDSDGNAYKIVASWWLKTLTGIAIFNFLLLALIAAVVIDNYRAIEQTLTFTDRVAQRDKALAEIAVSRAKANIWAFNEACDYATKQGRTCPAPKWYADPLKYPLIVDDAVVSAGLFPPRDENK